MRTDTKAMNCGAERLLVGRRSARAGLSLIELIVATAILSILLSGMAAVFVSSMRAVKAGFQSMDAYSLSRGAFEVLDRDLSTAFTSRDRGEYYSFFGTPYGMVFVGKASGFRGSGESDAPGFVRVSYVLRQIHSGPIETRDETILAHDTVKVRDFTDPEHPRQARQEVFVLVRYVEAGLSDLDAYPGVDWSGNAYDFTVGDAPFQTNMGQNIQAETGAINSFFVDYPTTTDPRGVGSNEREALDSAKKRELWLRMLRGNGPIWDPNDGRWETLPTDQWVPDFFDSDPFDSDLEPRLYYNEANGAWEEDAVNGPFKPSVLDHIVARNIVPMIDDSPVTGLYNGFRPEFDPGIWIFEYMEDAFARDFSVGATATSYTDLRPRYWNSDRNAALLATDPLTSPGMFTYGGIGSPLAPHLPGAVRVRLELVFPAPNVGAPDMHRFVDETIDIPTAFGRPPVYFPKEY